MTISGYQSYSYSAIQMRVTVTSGVRSTEAPDVPAPSPAADAPSPSRATRRADALFTALDGDNDGSISEDEFKDGALNLLRNAGARRRIDENGDADGRKLRGLGRLERKLEKLFERVDRNDDGAIDKNELTAELARGRQAGPDGAPPADAPPQDGQATGAVTMSLSVTFVSIAVQRYAAVQNTAAPTTTAAAPAPKDSPTAATPAIAA